MRYVALVSCVSKKLDHPAPAKELYQSQWFKKARALAEKRFDEWYILSAKHYLLHPDAVIEPYEMTLNTMKREDRINWALRVYAQILEIEKPDLITFYAGSRYREFLFPLLFKNGFDVGAPMEGLGIGKQMQWMNKMLTNDRVE